MCTRLIRQRDASRRAGNSHAEQVSHLARSIASGAADELKDVVEGRDAFERLLAFIDSTIGKRIEWLKGALEFVAPAFDEWAEIVEEYCLEGPVAAVGENVDDADALLAWLEATRPMTPVQQDYVACQRARNAVEALALNDRLAYVRFLEIASLVPQFAEELQTNPDAARNLSIHVNPIQAWARMQSGEFLSEDSDPETQIVFFPLRGDISSAELSPSAAALLHDLESRGPVTLEEWIRTTEAAGPDELTEFVQALASIGLIAFS
jgi:hypothetical protein